jgi:cytochrome b561
VKRWFGAFRRSFRQAAEFSIGRRLMHWAVLILCLVQVPTSWAIQRTHMAHLFFKPKPIDLFLHEVHAWSGWLILFFAIAQLVLRLTHGTPPPPEGSARLERWAAVAIHTMLYGLIIALPVTGTAAMYLSFRFAPLHSLLSWTLLAVALAHVAAALWHHIYRRDDVLLRMIGRAS